MSASFVGENLIAPLVPSFFVLLICQFWSLLCICLLVTFPLTMSQINVIYFYSWAQSSADLVSLRQKVFSLGDTAFDIDFFSDRHLCLHGAAGFEFSLQQWAEWGMRSLRTLKCKGFFNSQKIKTLILQFKDLWLYIDLCVCS